MSCPSGTSGRLVHAQGDCCKTAIHAQEALKLACAVAVVASDVGSCAQHVQQPSSWVHGMAAQLQALKLTGNAKAGQSCL